MDSYDAGLYTLRAENEAGESEAELELTVWEVPKITLDRDVYHVTAGDGFTIDAEVSGNPEARLSWSHNSIRITSNGRRLTMGNKLVWSSIKPSDSGSYSVMASNAAGVVTRRFEVIVNVSPSFELKPPVAHSVAVGDQLKLICSAQGHPIPLLTWHREDLGLGDNSKIVVDSSQAGLAVLTIDNVAGGDTGAYICTAENEVGSTSAITVVNVDMLP